MQLRHVWIFSALGLALPGCTAIQKRGHLDKYLPGVAGSHTIASNIDPSVLAQLKLTKRSRNVRHKCDLDKYFPSVAGTHFIALTQDPDLLTRLKFTKRGIDFSKYWPGNAGNKGYIRDSVSPTLLKKILKQNGKSHPKTKKNAGILSQLFGKIEQDYSQPMGHSQNPHYTNWFNKRSNNNLADWLDQNDINDYSGFDYSDLSVMKKKSMSNHNLTPEDYDEHDHIYEIHNLVDKRADIKSKSDPHDVSDTVEYDVAKPLEIKTLSNEDLMKWFESFNENESNNSHAHKFDWKKRHFDGGYFSQKRRKRHFAGGYFDQKRRRRRSLETSVHPFIRSKRSFITDFTKNLINKTLSQFKIDTGEKVYTRPVNSKEVDHEKMTRSTMPFMWADHRDHDEDGNSQSSHNYHYLRDQKPSGSRIGRDLEAQGMQPVVAGVYLPKMSSHDVETEMGDSSNIIAATPVETSKYEYDSKSAAEPVEFFPQMTVPRNTVKEPLLGPRLKDPDAQIYPDLASQSALDFILSLPTVDEKFDAAAVINPAKLHLDEDYGFWDMELRRAINEDMINSDYMDWNDKSTEQQQHEFPKTEDSTLSDPEWYQKINSYTPPPAAKKLTLKDDLGYTGLGMSMHDILQHYFSD